MPKGPRKYDPQLVEHEYVTGDISLRKLAEKHGVSFSSLAAYARSKDWTGRRIAYQTSLSRRTYEVMAADQANIKGSINEDSMKVLRATLSVYAEQLAARKVSITPKDAIESIRALAILLGQEEGGRDTDGPVTVTGTSRTINADLLRGVAAAARGRLATESILGGDTPGEPSRTRPN